MIVEDEDYESGPYNVTIPAETTSIQFDVIINDDNVSEGNENFNLTINSSSLSNRVAITNPTRATVTILDNDGNNYT